jgi:hypothetical protein
MDTWECHRLIRELDAYTNEIVGYPLGEFITPCTDTDSNVQRNI